jgi:hypothetical protein
LDRLHGVLVGGAKLKVRHIYVDGDTTIAELRSSSKTNEGATFANNDCWLCRFDGAMIVEVRAYLDSAMVDYTIHRNENRLAVTGKDAWPSRSGGRLSSAASEYAGSHRSVPRAPGVPQHSCSPAPARPAAQN